MTINKTNISKFSIAEAHNDSNGKSSNSKYNGTKIITTGCLAFMLSTIGVVFMKIPEAGNIAILATGVIATGATLSGYSKKKSTIDTTNTNTEDKQ
jgi:amino acid permease